MFNIIKDNLFLWIIFFLLIVSPSLLFGAMQVFVYIILAVVLLVIIGGLVLRWKISKMVKNGGANFGSYSRYSGYNAEQQQSQRGGGNPRVKIVVTDESGAATEKKVSKDVGDYVEFEEIKK